MNLPHPLSERLIERYQRGLPLTPRPYRDMARALGAEERDVLAALTQMRDSGVLSRVGPVLRPHTVGASTLAAMAVPPARLGEVARVVSGRAQVNHNYEREHRFNLWFVVTAGDEAGVRAVLDDIAARTGLPVLDLPMVRDYHIDLGFRIGEREDGSLASREPASVCASPWAAGNPMPATLDHADRLVLAATEGGIALRPRPFAAVAADTGLAESAVRERLAALLAGGVIKRMGLVVRHRQLGFAANAMVVWDVPDRECDRLGQRMAAYEAVTLCYRRLRRKPQWPYNLYCMIHGRDRRRVLAAVAALSRQCALDETPRAVLFSRRCFKQRGARYAPGITTPAAEDGRAPVTSGSSRAAS